MNKIFLIFIWLLLSNDVNSQTFVDTIEIDRVKLEKNRVEFVKKNLELSDSQSVMFWPMYYKYRSEVETIDDETLTLIRKYARHYNLDSISNELATQLMSDFMKLDQRRLNLKNKYINILSDKLPIKVVWRYFHIESNMDTSIKNSYINQIPLVNN